MNSVPTEKHWNMLENAIDLDISCAYRNFNGKTHEQAVAMFVESTLVHQEDVMWMPFDCFSFYVHAYMQYLQSDESIGDSDGASCFFSVVGFRLNEILNLDDSLVGPISVTLEFIGDNQRRFDADDDIYGSFRGQANKLLFKLSKE
jgi:hypothetical protein